MADRAKREKSKVHSMKWYGTVVFGGLINVSSFVFGIAFYKHSFRWLALRTWTGTLAADSEFKPLRVLMFRNLWFPLHHRADYC